MKPAPITITLDPEASEILRDLGPAIAITCRPSQDEPERMELVVVAQPTTASK